ALFPRVRFSAKIPARPVHRRKHARLGREIRLPAVPPSPPFAESRSRPRQFCSTNGSAAARLCHSAEAVPRRGPGVFFPSAAHGALPLRPCEEERLCVSHPAHARRDHETSARSPL